MNSLKHVAIIMDGNGRWGLKYKKSRNLGHKEGLKTVEKIIKETADNNPQLVKDYKNGKQKVIGFFVGQILKATNKKCNPAEVKKK